MNIITVFLTDEEILNKRNRNLDSYYGNEDTSPDNNFSETLYNNIYLILPLTIQNQFYLLLRKLHKKTRERSTSINSIPDFTVRFESPDGQSSNIDKIYEKNKIQSFEDNILQNLREKL